MKKMSVKRLHPSSILTGQIQLGSFAWVGEEFESARDYKYIPHVHIWLSVEYGEFCPLNCIHCGWQKQVVREQIPLDLLLNRLEELFQSPHKPEFLSISGKEPSITKKETLAIASIAKKFGSKTIMMTNGIGFTKDFMKQTRGLIDYLDLSIDGSEKYHEIVRGKGMFKRALKALDLALEFGNFEKIGIISTATTANIDGIPELIEQLDREYPKEGRIRHSIGMYHGLPGDKLLLKSKDVVRLLGKLVKLNRPSSKQSILFLYYSNYAYFLHEVLQEFNLKLEDSKICKISGLPILELPNLQIALLNHNHHILFIPRISTDGYLFLSCTHLVIPKKSSPFAIGDITEEKISNIIDRFFENPENEYFDFTSLSEEPLFCKENCPFYDICGGGDRLLGLYLGDRHAYDPFCERIPSFLKNLENKKLEIIK